MQELTKIILLRSCPYCHAWANEWCHSPKSGKRSRLLHSVRGEQVYAAWRVGYREGIEDTQPAAWDEGYAKGNLDGYFGTSDEKNPYSGGGEGE